MCGIVGIWGFLHDKPGLIAQACSRLHHRGPDGAGIWKDDEAGVTLGHVRLAVLDTSAAGSQPMVSACGRYVLLLNGEIYNHLALREQLAHEDASPPWRGRSGTETLLTCFAAWGIEKTLEAAIGMFAMALWDRHEGTLALMRDRMGEKPLYAGFVGNSFVFASELKALEHLPGLDRSPDPRALSLLMRHNYIPAPWSIYRQLSKVSPGCWLQLNARQCRIGEMPAQRSYWSAALVARDASEHPLPFDDDAAVVDALEQVPATAFDQAPPGGIFPAMTLLDVQTYLPDDILVKMNRAAMAASLETRVPLLDHHVYAFARRLPMHCHVRGGQGKWLLRQLLYRHVPAELIERPKKGFSVPLAQWLRGPLREWAHALLDPVHLRRDGVLHEPAVQPRWREHLSGRRDWSKHLWSILMVQPWLRARETGKPGGDTP